MHMTHLYTYGAHSKSIQFDLNGSGLDDQVDQFCTTLGHCTTVAPHPHVLFYTSGLAWLATITWECWERCHSGIHITHTYMMYIYIYIRLFIFIYIIIYDYICICIYTCMRSLTFSVHFPHLPWCFTVWLDQQAGKPRWFVLFFCSCMFMFSRKRTVVDSTWHQNAMVVCLQIFR